MRIGKNRGSYMPVLSHLVNQTTGPILELGVGFCSTPYLHWVCYPKRRKLVSYENNPEYYEFAKSWEDDFHQIRLITDWKIADLSEPWAIAFVDHSSRLGRGREAARLTHADYVILHDTENSGERRYRYGRASLMFKYKFKYTGAYPPTSVWSNLHDVTGLQIP